MFPLAMTICLPGCGGDSSKPTSSVVEKQSAPNKRKSVAELDVPQGHGEVLESKCTQAEWDAYFANGAPGAFLEYDDGTVIDHDEIHDWTEGGVVLKWTTTRKDDGRSKTYVNKLVLTPGHVSPRGEPCPYMGLRLINPESWPKYEPRKASHTFTIDGVALATDRYFEAKQIKAWLSTELPLGGLVRREETLPIGSINVKLLTRFSKGKRD